MAGRILKGKRIVGPEVIATVWAMLQ